MESYHRSAQAILAPALSLLSLVLCIPPMIWHASNRNWGAAFLVVYVMYGDLVNIPNALIWPTDDVNSWWDGAVYCDIQVKLSLATEVGMPGALLCIFRSLALVMDVNKSALIPTRGERLRNKAIDVFFCIGLPVLAMAVHFIVQGTRYYIFAVAGCNPTMDESWPSYVFLAWPLIICMAAAGYCILIIVRLIKYTSEFSAILGASRSNLTKQRFIRLFGLSLLMILFILPLQVYIFYTNIQTLSPAHPYSWKATHGLNLSHITKVPTNGRLKFDRWLSPAFSVLIFIFFGLGQDAANMYNNFFNVVGLKGFSMSFSSWKSTSVSSSSSGENNKGNNWYDSLRSKSSCWLGSRRAYVSAIVWVVYIERY
ncbi:uncharacterized protein BHQ10_006790 [Talaromyces amestolkiae]|uniref:A-pheromone receptor PreA n=1 Tax=Talaromyces amestolkiae TaxID=1196081 RepID=A0A364L4P2_TALAM|nr:uncharacterized protein BHQ10_006790 [Talaromyces amestolkiae]RAO70778.1 hypothetical protein BHQ10_006790 [Talaromyces amestolkiae]